MNRVVIRLPYPPSANELWTIGQSWSGRRRFICSKKYEDWISASYAAVGFGTDVPKLDSAEWYDVEITFFPKRSGKVDVDNRTKAVLDMMTRLEVWEDDSRVRKATTIKGAPSSEPFAIVAISVSTDDQRRPEDFGGVGLKSKQKKKRGNRNES